MLKKRRQMSVFMLSLEFLYFYVIFPHFYAFKSSSILAHLEFDKKTFFPPKLLKFSGTLNTLNNTSQNYTQNISILHFLFLCFAPFFRMLLSCSCVFDKCVSVLPNKNMFFKCLLSITAYILFVVSA